MYLANQFIADYLIGKGLVPTSFDYRYYYFTEGVPLTTALGEMPLWMRIDFANLWD